MVVSNIVVVLCAYDEESHDEKFRAQYQKYLEQREVTRQGVLRPPGRENLNKETGINHSRVSTYVDFVLKII